jgi:hypothetical protein
MLLSHWSAAAIEAPPSWTAASAAIDAQNTAARLRSRA